MEATAWILLICLGYLAFMAFLVALGRAASRPYPKQPRTRDHYEEAA